MAGRAKTGWRVFAGAAPRRPERRGTCASGPALVGSTGIAPVAGHPTFPAAGSLLARDRFRSVATGDGSGSGGPAPAPGGTGAGGPSIGRVPDDGEGVVIVLAGGAAEIGVELPRPELGRGEAQRDVFLAGGLALPHPTGTDLDTLGQHPEVGLAVGALGCVWHEVDIGADAEGPELALVAAGGLLGDV